MRAARSLVPELPQPAWVLLGGVALSALGSGLTLPFLLVYLDGVRGLDIAVAALAVSTIAIAGFVGNPLGGWLADRLGARDAVAAGLVLAAAGAFGLALVREPWHAFAAAAVAGLGAAIVWPAQDALLAALVPPAQRSGGFALHHALLNAGFGVGGVVAALVVDATAPRTFELVYVLDGLSFLAFLPFLFRLPRGRADHVEHVEGGGFRRVLADRTFVRLWALTALLVAAGYAQYHAAFPAFATGSGGLGVDELAIAFAANTFVVAVLQLVSLRAMRGRRRTRGLALAGVVFAAAWLVTLLGESAGGGTAALLVFVLAMALLGVGETLVPPSLPPLVNELASDELRGRYNGVSTLAWTTGFAAGPALAGLFLASGHAHALFLALAACCALVSAGAVRLERRLAPSANLVPALA